MHGVRVLVAIAAAGVGLAAGSGTYQLNGVLDPPERGAVSIWGYSTPFGNRTETDPRGRFRFKNLRQGTYTVAVLVRGRGEIRRTVEVGPGVADARRRVEIVLKLSEADPDVKDTARRLAVVPAAELAVPEKARKEFEEALRDLSRHRTESAVRHLERAVEIAPRFAIAWNDLGTIAYRNRQYLRALECFRKSLAADPQAFEPLVNLGGVLVTLNRPDESIDYNLNAVLQRPGDALANSQLGMNYYQLGKYDLSGKYLEAARRIDPGHFSHPQLLLSEVKLREGRRDEAAVLLEEFLRYHPDYAEAAKMRAAIAKLKQ